MLLINNLQKLQKLVDYTKNFKLWETMNKMNNFELHEQALNLSSVHTSYTLAKQLLQEKQELEELKEKYDQLNAMFEDYLNAHKVIQVELERLQMQGQICPDKVRIHYELECG